MATDLVEPVLDPRLQLIFEKALIEAQVGVGEIDLLLAGEAELIAGLAKQLKVFGRGHQFVGEEEPSDYLYPRQYKTHDLGDQIAVFRRSFHRFSPKYSRAVALRGDAQRWSAIPRWSALASSYAEALQLLFAALTQQYSGHFQAWEGIDLQAFSLLERTEESLKQIGREQQRYNTLLLRAQLGIKYRGKSPNRSLELMDQDEFGLDLFSAGCMLLAHPERLRRKKHLWMDCSGSIYFHEGKQKVPYFYATPDGLRLGVVDRSRYFKCCGTASGFLSSE